MPFRYTNPTTGQTWKSKERLSDSDLEELFTVDVPSTSARESAKDPVGEWLAGVTGGKPPEVTPASQAFSDKANAVAGRVAGTAARVGVPLAVGAATGGMGIVPTAAAMATGGIAGGMIDDSLQGQEPSAGGVIADAAMGVAAMAPVKAATLPGALAKGGAIGWSSVTIDSILRDQEIPSAGRMALGTIIGAVGSGVVHKLNVRSALNEVLPRDQGDIVAKILNKEKLDFQGSQSSKEAVAEIHEVQKSIILNQFGKPFEHQALEPDLIPLPTKSPRLPNTKPNPATSAGREITPPKFFFDKVQTQTDIPVFDEAYYPIHEAATKANHEISQVSQDLKHVFKGLTGSKEMPRRQSITQWMQADDTAQVGLETSMRKDDIGRGLQLQDMMRKRFASAGLDWDEFFKKHLPQLKQAGSIEDAFPVEVPKEIQYFKNQLDDEFIGAGDVDSLGIVARLQKTVINKEMLDPTISSVRDKFIGKGLDSSVEEPIKEYMTRVRGSNDQTHKDLSRFWNYVRERTPILKNLTRKETKDHIDTILGLQYAGTMAGRLPPLTRNGMQTAMTGYMYLGKWYPVGIKKALGKGGYDFAVQNGALGAEEGLGSEMSNLMGTQSRLGRITAQGFRPYRAIDEYNRSIMFHGGYEKAISAGERASFHGRDVKKFVDLADLDVGFGRAEATRIAQLFAEGKTTEAARQYGIALADNTQFMYSAGERVPITTGSTPRRVAGAFGNWPLWYGHMLKEAVSGPGGWQKKGIVLARWAAANGAIAGGVGVLANAAGVEHPWRSGLGYTFLGPAVFGLGPGVELIQKNKDALGGLVSGRRGISSAVKTEAKALKPFVPYYYAGQDVTRFVKTTNDRSFGEAVLNASGLVPYGGGKR